VPTSIKSKSLSELIGELRTIVNDLLLTDVKSRRFEEHLKRLKLVCRQAGKLNEEKMTRTNALIKSLEEAIENKSNNDARDSLLGYQDFLGH